MMLETALISLLVQLEQSVEPHTQQPAVSLQLQLQVLMQNLGEKIQMTQIQDMARVPSLVQHLYLVHNL
jgi:hypothetical protein